MTDEDAFLTAIRANPRDDTTRLVFADWLDERGDEKSALRAKYLRTDVELGTLSDDDAGRDGLVLLLKRFARSLPTKWKASVAKVPVEGCGIEWKFQCPKKWDSFAETADPKVRMCGACEKPVHFCDSIEKAQELAWSGECVAIDLRVKRTLYDLDPPMVATAGLIEFDYREDQQEPDPDDSTEYGGRKG